MSFEREADVNAETPSVELTESHTPLAGNSMNPIIACGEWFMTQDIERTDILNTVVPVDSTTRVIQIAGVIIKTGGLGTDDYIVRIYRGSVNPGNIIYENTLVNPGNLFDEFEVQDTTPGTSNQTYILGITKTSGGNDNVKFFVRIYFVAVGSL